MKHKENETYQLVPDTAHDQDWNVRILEGMYNETVLKIGGIAFNEIEEHLSFDFHVVQSPDTELNEEDEELQDFVAGLLEHIITVAIEKDELVMKEREKE
jgi:hypothetical protein